MTYVLMMHSLAIAALILIALFVKSENWRFAKGAAGTLAAWYLMYLFI